MKIKHANGFTLLEVMLALLILALSGYGVYSLYRSTQSSYTHDQLVQQVATLSTTYQQLSQAHLTQGLKTADDFTQLMKNSMQLPATYFSIDEAGVSHLANSLGPIEVVTVSDNQVQFKFPVDVTSYSARQAYCEALKNYTAACMPIAAPLLGAKSSLLLITLQGDN